MDAYFHDKIIGNIRRTVKKTAPDFPADLVNLLAEGQKANEVARTFLQIAMKPRPLAHVCTIVAHSLSERSYQDPGKIERGLRMIGVARFWELVSVEMDATEKELKRQIVNYVKRRHSIVHAGDLGIAKKTRHRPKKISKPYTETSIDAIEKFIHKADSIIDLQI